MRVKRTSATQQACYRSAGKHALDREFGPIGQLMTILLEEAFPALIVLEQKLCGSRYVHDAQYKMRPGRWKGLRLRSRRAHAAGVLPFIRSNEIT
nr:hypothetical protein 376p_00023 [Serratia liquefaciens]ULG12984.1 hypothetical protein 377p_00020 [Serratia liquefaciens]